MASLELEIITKDGAEPSPAAVENEKRIWERAKAIIVERSMLMAWRHTGKKLRKATDANTRLLAVARAAAKTIDQDYIGDCTCRECKGIRDEVAEALAAVEDLL